MPVTPNTPYNAKNVLYGSQKLYVAPYGTPLPVINPGATPAATTVTLDPAWGDGVGYTNAGSTLEYAPTMKDIMVDEAMTPVAVLKTAEMLKITTALSEATLENLTFAISGASFLEAAAGAGVADVATITVGGSQLFNAFAACFVGVGAYGFPRVTVVYNCHSTAKISLAFKKDSEIMIPVELSGLADTGLPGLLYQVKS